MIDRFLLLVNRVDRFKTFKWRLLQLHFDNRYDTDSCLIKNQIPEKHVLKSIDKKKKRVNNL